MMPHIYSTIRDIKNHVPSIFGIDAKNEENFITFLLEKEYIITEKFGSNIQYILLDCSITEVCDGFIEWLSGRELAGLEVQ